MLHTGKFNKIPLKKRGGSKTSNDDGKASKLPRLDLKYLKPRAEPVFSIPKELICLSVPPKKVKAKQSRQRNEKGKKYTVIQIFSAILLI